MKTLTKRAKNSKTPSSLRSLGIAIKVPRQPKCTVADCFADKKIFECRDTDFDNLLPTTLPASKAASVSGYELTKYTKEKTLLKVGKGFTNLKQMEDLILRTENGENTGLVTNGNANLFFLKIGATVFTVRAYRYSDGWGVLLDRFSAGYEWDAEFRFFSPTT